jgi:hypothetical protein
MRFVLGIQRERLTLEAVGGVHGGRGTERIHARLELHGLDAACTIWLGPSDREPPLSSIFEEISGGWRGWSGTKQWAAYEGGLELSFTHDGLGHVRMVVELRKAATPDGWCVRGVVPLDAGALDRYATAAAALDRTSDEP